MIKTLLGKVVPGFKEGAKYISMPFYNILITELLDEAPYPGTLNLRTNITYRELVKECPPSHIKSILINGEERGGFYYWFGDVISSGEDSVSAIVIRPFLSRHPPNVLEVVSPVNLRERFSIKDGSDVKVRLICGVQPLNG